MMKAVSTDAAGTTAGNSAAGTPSTSTLSTPSARQRAFSTSCMSATGSSAITLRRGGRSGW